MIYRRKANLADLPQELLDGKVLADRRVLGVWVARVVESPLFEGVPSKIPLSQPQSDTLVGRPPRRNAPVRYNGAIPPFF